MTFRLSPGSSRCLVAPFVCCQDQRGAEVGLGGARMVPPMPGCPPPMLGAGAVGREGTDCCCLRGFCCNWGETLRSQLRVGIEAWGAAEPGPLSLPVTQVLLCKGSRWEQCLERSHGPPSWAQPPALPRGLPLCPMEGEGQQVQTWGQGVPCSHHKVHVLGRGWFWGRSGELPSSRARVLWEAVELHWDCCWPCGCSEVGADPGESSTPRFQGIVAL